MGLFGFVVVYVVFFEFVVECCVVDVEFFVDFGEVVVEFFDCGEDGVLFDVV